MTPQILIAPILLLIASVAYIFWPQQKLAVAVEKTRLDYLRERKEAVYENLRDLNFEYRAGKYPEADYATQRNSLENEAATILTEMDSLGG
jgi:cbb3-type cytochrome oxidase subunit 3